MQFVIWQVRADPLDKFQLAQLAGRTCVQVSDICVLRNVTEQFNSQRFDFRPAFRAQRSRELNQSQSVVEGCLGPGDRLCGGLFRATGSIKRLIPEADRFG